MPEHITKAQYARHRKVSKAAITKALRSGRIVLGDDGLLDPEIADRQWLANTNARIPGPGRTPARKAPAPAQDEPADYSESRARREQSEAGLAALALGEANGRLLARDRVELAVFHASRALRDQLTNSSAHLGAAVAPMTTAAECERTIRLEHVRLLEAFVHELARMIAAPAA